MSDSSLTIVDNRTGKRSEIAVTDGTVRALELRSFKTCEGDFGLMTYDPGFSNTACCRSAITYIDGDVGILRYRGYPIEQLAEKRRFTEVAYLIHEGELPDGDRLRAWEAELSDAAWVHKNVRRLLETFPGSANPMTMLASAVPALGVDIKDAGRLVDASSRRRAVVSLIAQVPILAACIHRHRKGLDWVHPRRDLSFVGNFLNMVFAGPGGVSDLDPVLERALDVLFTLHADHEQNCSTNAMRSVGSSRPDPFLAAAAAIGALAGPLHGGANAAVLRMLEAIGSVDRVPETVRKAKDGEMRLMGFGHRVYKNYDPRARIIKKLADEVFAVTGSSPLLDIALELERIALRDDYFVSRKLYPNVDFYSGLIYQAMGFPTEMFTVLFAVARTVGWASQWEEMMRDPDLRIARPRQIYTGPAQRDVP